MRQVKAASEHLEQRPRLSRRQWKSERNSFAKVLQEFSSSVATIHLAFINAFAVLFAAFAAAAPVAAQQPVAAGQQAALTPTLRLLPQRPVSRTLDLEFSPDGSRLYATGWDKVVHAWSVHGGRLRYEPAEVLRVPIGGGLDGAPNVLSVSADGRFVAVGGRAVKTGVPSGRQSGALRPSGALPDEIRIDEGTITVFDRQTGRRSMLRGHAGAIAALKFLGGGERPLLVSIGDEWTGSERMCELRCWRVNGDDPLVHSIREIDTADGQSVPVPPFVPPAIVPGFAPLPAAAGQPSRVLVGWNDTVFGLRVWTPEQKKLEPVATDLGYVWLGLAADESFMAADESGENAEIGFLAGDMRTRETVAGELRIGDGPQPDVTERAFRRWPAGSLPIAVEKHGNALFVQQLQPGFRESHLLRVTETDETLLGSVASTAMPIAVGPAMQNGGETSPNVAVVDAAGTVGLVPPARLGSDADAAGGAAKLEFAGSLGGEVVIETARFAERNGRRGLLLTDAKGRKAVFKIDSSTLSLDTEGWTETRTTPAGEIVSRADGIVRVRRVDGRTIDIAPPCGDQPGELVITATRTVFVPRVGAFVAVALECRGEPKLQLFDLASGQHVRSLVAHTGTIRSLHVSPEGDRLLSGADDGTLRVWRLDDLAEHVGEHGAIRDADGLLAVKAGDDGGLVVAADFLALREGEAIGSVEIDGEAVDLDSASAFYDRLYHTRPKTAVLLRTDRKPEGHPFELGQAIDVQRELLAFHVAALPSERDGKATGGRWIVWSPFGPYDRSDEASEADLGWHFDDGTAGSDVRYADIGEYREEFLRPGLMQPLLTRGEFPARPQPPAPEVSLDLRREGGAPLPVATTGETLLPLDTATTLFVQVDADFPSRDLASVRWRLDGPTDAPTGEANEIESHLYEVTIPAAQIPRTATLLFVEVRTQEREPRMFTAAATVRANVPSPRLSVAVDGELTDPNRTVVVTVEPSPRAVELTLTHVDSAGQAIDSKTVTVPVESTRPIRWDVAFTSKTQPASHRVRVQAKNADAPPELAKLETVRQSVDLSFRPDPDSLRPILQSARWTLPDESRVPFGAAEMSSGTASLDGHAAVKTETAVVGWASSTGIDVRKTFPADDGGTIQFSLPVSFARGGQTGTLTVTDAEGRSVSQQTEIGWYPPSLSLTAIAYDAVGVDGSVVADWSGELVDGRERPEVRTRAVVVPQDGVDLADIAFDVLVDGRPVGAKIVREGVRLEATVPIEPGRHQLRWLSIAPWDEDWASPQAQFVHRIAPPTVTDATGPQTVKYAERPSLSFVVNPGDVRLSAEATEVRINGQRLVEDFRIELQPADAAGAVRLTIGDLALPSVGANVVTVRPGGPLTADDAENPTAPTAPTDPSGRVVHALQPGTWTIDQAEPVREPPRVISLDLPGQTADSPVTVRFAVEQREPLDRVELVIQSSAGGSRPQIAATIGRDDLMRRLGASSRATFERDVPLPLGTNSVTVVAYDADGRTDRKSAAVTFTPRPVIDGQLQVSGSEDEANLIGSFQGERRKLGEVESPRLDLKGYLNIPEGTHRHESYARIWVNGFRQSDITFSSSKTGARGTNFRGTVVLNRRYGNRIQIEPPKGMPVDAAFRGEFYVDCKNPATNQQVYAIVIGLDESDGAALRKRALASISAEVPERARQIASVLGGVDSNAVYTMTGDDVSQDRFKHHIRSIRQKMDTDRKGMSESPLSPVVLVYYEGREWSAERMELRRRDRDETDFLLEMWGTVLDDGEAFASEMLSDAEIRRELRPLGGAHLLFLDVVAGEPDRTLQSQWNSGEYLGLFRLVRHAAGAPPSGELLAAIREASQQSAVLDDVRTYLQSRFNRERSGRFADLQIDGPLSELPLATAGMQ